jgi:hypothetical protein
MAKIGIQANLLRRDGRNKYHELTPSFDPRGIEETRKTVSLVNNKLFRTKRQKTICAREAVKEEDGAYRAPRTKFVIDAILTALKKG